MPDTSEHTTAQARYPRPHPDVSAFTLDDELILCSETNPTVFALNQTGAMVWELCDGERSVRCIARRFADVVGIDDAQALEDVTELMAQLEQVGLLIMTGPVGERVAPDAAEPTGEGAISSFGALSPGTP